jgi:hypothetical protein
LQQRQKLPLVLPRVFIKTIQPHSLLHVLHRLPVSGPVADAGEEGGELVEVLFRPLVVGVLVALRTLETDAGKAWAKARAFSSGEPSLPRPEVRHRRARAKSAGLFVRK